MNVPGHVVIDHLNRGPDLDVWDVWSEHRACRCIVKTLAPGAGRGARTRLLREGRLLKRFAHPHLVRAYEVHEDLPAVVQYGSGSAVEEFVQGTKEIFHRNRF